MAQVELIQQRSAAARAGTLDAQQYQDLKHLKTELAIAKGNSSSQSLSHKAREWPAVAEQLHSVCPAAQGSRVCSA